MKHGIQYLCITLFSAFMIWRGIIPALTEVDTDFPNYYTASRLLVEGKNISRLYDDKWFQEQITSYGINQQGKFSPFPPVTAFIMIPIAFFPPHVALQVWTVINIGILLGIIIIFMRITNADWQLSSFIVLGSGIALANNFRFGQFYLVLIFIMLLSYHLLQRQRLISSGVLLGIGAALKYFPVIFLPLFIAYRQWQLVLSFTLSVVVIHCIGVDIFGGTIYKQFLTSILVDHFSGNIQDPFNATFQSWNSLLHRLFVYDQSLNPAPILNSTMTYYILKYFIYAIVCGITIWVITKTAYMAKRDHYARHIAITTVAGMLLLPASATYHFLILVLPVALLLNNGTAWNISQKFLVGCYLMIGFLPYRFFRSFDGQGILTLIAYPRLWITATIFITVTMYMAKFSRNSLPTRV